MRTGCRSQIFSSVCWLIPRRMNPRFDILRISASCLLSATALPFFFVLESFEVQETCSAPLKTRRSGSPSLGQLQKPRRPRAEYDF